MDDTQHGQPQAETGVLEIRVPKLPESIADATLVTWHKKPGEAVRRDDNLVDIETDKVVLEVPAPADGVLQGIEKHDGDTVVSEELLATLSRGAAAPTAAVPPKPAAEPEPEPASGREAPPLSPAVRRLVEEHGLNAADIPASGRDGRPTKADVLQYLQSREPGAAEPPPQAPAEAASAPASGHQPAPAAEAPAARTEPQAAAAEAGMRRVPMSRLRQRIAERMVEAQHTAAILSTFNEINMQAVFDLRRQYKERFEQQHGVKLGLMSFFIKAGVEALKRFPIVNASVEDGDILYHDYYDVSLAVSTPRGLVVPVLRDADRLTFAEIESAIVDFAQRARDGNLTIDELSGGTFTITNGGVFGSLLSTPILNPPQSAILGLHKVQERPVAEDGEVRIRPMMYTALSYDHRIIDGRDAVQFLVAVKELLEDPARLLLQV
ncbi:MAG: 2-oxoglutarate dehydrogenase complex dihydrolipoyllysine-residue succinyltransferase [Gammaproteobacteria bacterium]